MGLVTDNTLYNICMQYPVYVLSSNEGGLSLTPENNCWKIFFDKIDTASCPSVYIQSQLRAWYLQVYSNGLTEGLPMVSACIANSPSVLANFKSSITTFVFLLFFLLLESGFFFVWPHRQDRWDATNFSTKVILGLQVHASPSLMVMASTSMTTRSARWPRPWQLFGLIRRWQSLLQHWWVCLRHLQCCLGPWIPLFLTQLLWYSKQAPEIKRYWDHVQLTVFSSYPQLSTYIQSSCKGIDRENIQVHKW